jgi:predicted nucleic acid-binding protein
MIHALLDTNVILDVLLDRTPWSTDAVALWQAKLDGQLSLMSRQLRSLIFFT